MRNALLIIGGVLIVSSGLFTLSHLVDRVIYTVLIPGFVFGLILIGIAMRLERHGSRRPG